MLLRTDRLSSAQKVLIWDLPTRVFHWLLAMSFAGAYITAESERWRHVHVTLGYTVAGLIAFRIVWGLVGTRHARFASFVRSPMEVWRYMQSMLTAQPQHHAGHNPAGAMAIIALLALGALTSITGWASFEAIAGGWLEDLHEGSAQAMLAMVGLHLAGVVISSVLHRENLARSMVTGRKAAAPSDAIGRSWRLLGLLLLAVVLIFWVQQWRTGAEIPRSTLHIQPNDDD